MKCLLATICLLCSDAALGSTFDPTEFGAIANDNRSDTNSIQQAIDKCFESGGGHVQLKQGIFIAGSLHLKAGVTLRIDKEATLECASDPSEFHRGARCTANAATQERPSSAAVLVNCLRVNGEFAEISKLQEE